MLGYHKAGTVAVGVLSSLFSLFRFPSALAGRPALTAQRGQLFDVVIVLVTEPLMAPIILSLAAVGRPARSRQTVRCSPLRSTAAPLAICDRAKSDEDVLCGWADRRR